MNDLVLTALIAVGASTGAAAVVILLLRRRIAAPVAVGAGYVAGHVVINEVMPSFPPVSTEHWLVYFALPVVVLAVIECQVERGHAWRWCSRAVVCLVGTYLFVQALVAVWSGLQSVAWVGAQALGWLVLWAAFDVTARRCDNESREWRPLSPLFLLGLLVVATSTSIALLNSSSAKLAQFAGGLASALGVCLVFAWWRPSWGLCRGAAAVSTFLLVCLVSEGYHYGQLPATSACLLVISGVAGWLGILLFVNRAGRWAEAVLRLVLTATPAIVAFALTIGGADDASSWGY